ncbi:MAG: hypothetical protein U9Q27_01575 [Patescibacteria group bacterium]|nr:hypothetical protein [Patescibacteria group bacterium]
MPSKIDKMTINNKSLDRRVRLSDDDRKKIKELFFDENYSKRKLANIFNVSRRTIQFIISPEKLEENKKRRTERGGSKVYYDKNKHKNFMKSHRNYKKKLFNEGLIREINIKQ